MRREDLCLGNKRIGPRNQHQAMNRKIEPRNQHLGLLGIDNKHWKKTPNPNSISPSSTAYNSALLGPF